MPSARINSAKYAESHFIGTIVQLNQMLSNVTLSLSNELLHHYNHQCYCVYCRSRIRITDNIDKKLGTQFMFINKILKSLIINPKSNFISIVLYVGVVNGALGIILRYEQTGQQTFVNDYHHFASVQNDKVVIQLDSGVIYTVFQLT